MLASPKSTKTSIHDFRNYVLPDSRNYDEASMSGYAASTLNDPLRDNASCSVEAAYDMPKAHLQASPIQPIVEDKQHQQIDERLGGVLRQLREARGWSLSYVGEICGTSAANVSKIERGLAKEYSLSLLSGLAGAHGMKLYQLFAAVDGLDLTGKAMGSEQRKLVEAYDSLSEMQQQTLMSVAMTLRPPI